MPERRSRNLAANPHTLFRGCRSPRPGRVCADGADLRDGLSEIWRLTPLRRPRSYVDRFAALRRKCDDRADATAAPAYAAAPSAARRRRSKSGAAGASDSGRRSAYSTLSGNCGISIQCVGFNSISLRPGTPLSTRASTHPDRPWPDQCPTTAAYLRAPTIARATNNTGVPSFGALSIRFHMTTPHAISSSQVDLPGRSGASEAR
jgi:hypothetical protein